MKALPEREVEVLLARLEAHVIELRARFAGESMRMDDYHRGMADGLEEAANTVRVARDRLMVELYQSVVSDSSYPPLMNHGHDL